MMGKQKIDEALSILKDLRLPKAQHNERSALTLLALTNIRPASEWKNAKRNAIRIHDILAFVEKYYGKHYAENTRETIRRETIHQFEQAGIVERNPDDSSRPTNSPHTVYRTTQEAHDALLSFGKKQWKQAVSLFLKKKGSLAGRYAKSREGERISVLISQEEEVLLSPGRHNLLQREVLQEFRPRFCKNARIVYLGDTAKKMSYVDRDLAGQFGLSIDEHEKLPDLVLCDQQTNILFLVEVVTAHGPVSAKRQIELERVFAKCEIRKVFVTVFPNLREFKRHVSDIAWETEVWIAETPDHMIHFNGPKFLTLHQQGGAN